MTDGDLFGRIVDACSSELWDVRIRGISLDVALIHIASMSNLMAALGWAMVDLIEHPAELDAVARGAGLALWRPDRWHRHRLADTAALPTPMLVTAFGHGRHSCPAQPFSLAAMTTAMTHLFGRYQMTAGWTTHPRPVPAQIGGVARAADPCPVDYRAT